MSVDTPFTETASEFDALQDVDVRDEVAPPPEPVRADTVNITGSAGEAVCQVVSKSGSQVTVDPSARFEK